MDLPVLQVPSPWGGNDNKQLFAMYRNSQMLGNVHWSLMRQHLLVVTVDLGVGRVQSYTLKTESMEAMIDNGEDWMMPTAGVSGFFGMPHRILETKGRYSRASKTSARFYQKRQDGKLIRGPYKLEFCKELSKAAS